MTPIPADTPGVLHGILQGVTAATGTLWSSGSIMVNMYPRVCTPTRYPLYYPLYPCLLVIDIHSLVHRIVIDVHSANPSYIYTIIYRYL